jgi:MYND finger
MRTWSGLLCLFISSLVVRNPKTHKALEEAVRFNPVVYALLMGDRLLAGGEGFRCQQKAKSYYTAANGRIFGLPHNAPIFYHQYSKYFVQDPALVPWLESQKETLKPFLNIDMEKPLDSPIDSHADYFAAVAVGDIGTKKKSAASKLGTDTLCCAYCGGIGNLSKCSRCQHVSYCNRQCQLGDWKNHKAFCRTSAKEKEGQQPRASDSRTTTEREEIGHPSWARLNVQTRQNLMKFHRDGGWEPWPVTAEAPAMLNHPCYSFLTPHPAMTFSAVVVETPRGFQMSYDNAMESHIHGRIFEAGQAPFLLLREDFSMSGRANCMIPKHNMGMSMEFCLQQQQQL